MDYYLDIMGAYSDSVYPSSAFTHYDSACCMGNDNAFLQVQTALLPLYIGSIKEMEEACTLVKPSENHFI